MRIRAGNGGWHAVDADPGLPGVTYFRVQEVGDRFRITELYIDGRGAPIQAGALRRLPLGALEQLASAVPTAFERLLVPGPDISRLAAHFSTTFGKASHWVADSMRAQITDSGVKQAPMPGAPLVKRPAEDQPEVRLAPPSEGLTDAFLEDFARAYEVALARRESPATAIAMQLPGYPTDPEGRVRARRTVESWTRKARQRGILAPATRRGRPV